MSDETRRSLDAFLNRRMYPALDPTILAGIDDDALEQAIIDFVLERAGSQGLEVADMLTSLNPAFSHVYATWITEAEVFNGGFNQYFFNRSGRLAPQAAAGYDAVGAPARERVVREAIQRVIENSPALAGVWSDRTLEGFSKSYDLQIFGDLDQAFYALDNVENGPQLRVAYIRAHPDELTAS
jgi:hypothetical protein